MSDSELRRLERAFIESPVDLSTRVAFGRALVRSGEHARAASLLEPLLDDATVREDLAGFPAWTHASGHAGRGAWSGGGGPSQLPVVRWRVRTGFPELIASSLAVVSFGPSEGVVLDPRTGAVRRRIAGARDLALAGTKIVALAPTRVVVFDLWSGERLEELEPNAGTTAVRVAGDRLVLASPWGLTIYRLGAKAELVSRFPAASPAWHTLHAVTDAFLLVQKTNAPYFTALDARTGAELWTVAGFHPLADEHGVFARERDDFVAYGTDGRLTFRAENASRVIALMGEQALEMTSDRRGVNVGVLHRSNGAFGRILYRTSFHERIYPKAIAAGAQTVFLSTTARGLVAATLEGREWSMTLDAVLSRLAPVNGALYATTEQGEVLRLSVAEPAPVH